MNKDDFIVAFKCDNCGHIEQLGAMQHVCRKCGDIKSRHLLLGFSGWTNVAVRKVSDFVWFKPSTWRKWHWEENRVFIK